MYHLSQSNQPAVYSFFAPIEVTGLWSGPGQWATQVSTRTVLQTMAPIVVSSLIGI